MICERKDKNLDNNQNKKICSISLAELKKAGEILSPSKVFLNSLVMEYLLLFIRETLSSAVLCSLWGVQALMPANGIMDRSVDLGFGR